MGQRPLTTVLLTALILWALWLWRAHKLHGAPIGGPGGPGGPGGLPPYTPGPGDIVPRFEVPPNPPLVPIPGAGGGPGGVLDPAARIARLA